MRFPRIDLLRYAPLIVAVAAAAVYANSLANGFAYDDVHIIEENARVHSLRAWLDFWRTPYWPAFGAELGLYRPLIITLYAVEWAMGDGAAWVFHAANVLLHTAASVLGFLLLERLTTRSAALLGALVFAVHPLHTEAVANIVGQAELVAGVALLAACLVHVTRPDRIAVSWPRRLALVVLFAVGLAAKESAVVLPGLLVALDLAQRRTRINTRELTAYADALIVPVFLLGATLVVYFILRFEALGGSLIGVDAGPPLPFLRGEHRILNALRAFPEFLRLLFFPLDLSADYSPGVVLPVDRLTGMTVLGGLLLIGMAAVALGTPWLPAAGLPAAWFLICISPVANLFFPIGVLVAERTLYVPSFAVSLLAAYAWQARIHAAPALTRAAPAAAVVVVALLAIRTWVRNPDWKNTPAIFSSLVRDHPESYKAQWFMASGLWNRNETAAASLHYELAYRIYKHDSQFLVEYGNYLLNQGRVQEAVPVLEASHARHPFVPRTLVRLAAAYIEAGRYEQALERIADAERHGVYRVVTMPLRARAYMGLGQYDHAVAAWRVARRHTTGNTWVAGAHLARALAISGDRAQALAALAESREQAQAEPAPLAALDRLEQAIRDGCYAGLSAHRAAGTAAPFVAPPCDPLGDYRTPSADRENPTRFSAGTPGRQPD